MDKNTTQDIDLLLGQTKSSRLRRYGFWLLLLLLLLTTYLVLRANRSPSKVQYITAPVSMGDIEITVTATGNLAPTNQVEVGSEISGIVDRVLVDVNDQVKEGEAIAVIDTSRLDDAAKRAAATLAANQASVEREQATLVEAQTQLERLVAVNRSTAGQLPARSELTNQQASVARATAALKLARANVASAEAQLSSDRTQLAKAVIRSPVAGVVLKRSVDPGQTVQVAFSSPSLFIIAEDLKRMKLEVAVDEADVGRVRAGQNARFAVDAYPGRSFPAQIARVNLGAKNLVSNAASAGATNNASNVVSYLANLTVSNDDLSLRPGMTATAIIQTDGAKQVLYVPNAALRFVSPANITAEEKKGFQFQPPRAETSTAVNKEVQIGAGSVQRVHVLGPDGQLRVIDVLTGASNGNVTAVSSPELRVGMVVVLGQKASAQ
jgi:HlyD family secretion protein